VFDAKLLRKIQATPRHVFCATEMGTGSHAFFTRNFIYSQVVGIGKSADLPLSTAVALSANFPVAFPYRILDVEKHDCRLRGYIARRPFVLSDGGIRDNMGITWFEEAPERKARLKRSLRLAISSGLEHITKRDQQWIEEQIDVMSDSTDQLIIVNSSYPPDWSNAWLNHIPFIGELASLVKVQATLYNYYTRTQCRQLHRQFFFQYSTGALVSIEQHPEQFQRIFRIQDNDEDSLLERTLSELRLSDLPETLREHYRELAESVRDRKAFGPDYKIILGGVAKRLQDLAKLKTELENQKATAPGSSGTEAELEPEIYKCDAEIQGLYGAIRRKRLGLVFNEEEKHEYKRDSEETMSSWKVPTTFRPLGVSATAALLRHGYLNCMNMCYLLMEGFPLFDDPPTIKEFQELACGTARQRYPAWRESAAPAS
jgi:hypothetical protein